MSVTGVTSVTDLYNPQILFPTSNQPVLQDVTTPLIKSASVTRVTSVTAFILQCYECYTRYCLHFPVLQALQVLQPSFSV